MLGIAAASATAAAAAPSSAAAVPSFEFGFSDETKLAWRRTRIPSTRPGPRTTGGEEVSLPIEVEADDPPHGEVKARWPDGVEWSIAGVVVKDVREWLANPGSS